MKLYALANKSSSALLMKGSQVVIILASDINDAKAKFRVYGISSKTLEKHNIIDVDISYSGKPINCFMY